MTTSLFCSGSTSARTSSIPSAPGHGLAVVRLSPVSMTTRIPSSRSPRSASGVEALTGSATAIRPAGRPSTTRNTAVWPSPRSASARSARSPGDTPSVSRSRALPSATRRPATSPRHPLPGDYPELRGFLQREPALPRAVDDRAGERVLAPALEAGRQAEEPRLVVGRQGHDGREPRAALRQRAGLVDDERVHLLEDLERLGVLDEDARRRAAAHAHHDGHRRREPERARARDDQDGHRGEQRVGEPGLGPDRAPDERAQHGHRHDRRDEVGGHPVRQALDRRAAPLGVGRPVGRSGRAACPGRPARRASRRRPRR